MSTTTTHYSFIKPAVNSSTDEDLWGTEWNTNADSIDTDLYAVSLVANAAVPAASPTLTGVPLSPTASAGTNTTQIATTAFVQQKRESFIVACSDETTVLTAGTAKVTFRMPYAITVTDVRASLTTAQTTGSIFTVDINDGGTTILSTKITIDNNEKTSTTAAIPPVISDTALADDASITIDIDQVGAATVAAGLKVTIIGHRG